MQKCIAMCEHFLVLSVQKKGCPICSCGQASWRLSFGHISIVWIELVIGGKSTVRTVYTVPQFTIPDDKILVIELVEKNGGRHQTIRVENSDVVAAKVINELKIK